MIRRATFDLTGLPPTPGEIAAFEADTTPALRTADRPAAGVAPLRRALGTILAGRRPVCRHQGLIFFQDANFHWAYTYRDYVIGAFNRDLPYDRFLIEQIAADRLAPERGKRPLWRPSGSSPWAAGSWATSTT